MGSIICAKLPHRNRIYLNNNVQTLHDFSAIAGYSGNILVTYLIQVHEGINNDFCIGTKIHVFAFLPFVNCP